LTDFINFRHAAVKRNLMQMSVVWPPRPKVVDTLPCEMQKS